MLGAIAGDVIGSVFEHRNTKSKDFELFDDTSCFTDDTVLTIASADAILNDRDYTEVLKEYHARYPRAGYGGSFRGWANSQNSKPYNSWGNGSAMRTSPVGFANDTLEEALAQAEAFAAVTHNHPEGIKGAQAVSAAILLARKGISKDHIKRFIETKFEYNLDTTLDEIRPTYRFDVSCQGSVPQAIRAFLESTDFEDTIRNAISIGGDSDTIACIAGGIAEAFYKGVPGDIKQETLDRLDDRMKKTITLFYQRFIT
ncbi:MAG: ADP-ribosylglycohydrolase family protein [Gammaproteobacteria bacterium]|nr:MAG: ADP-ribosylglycohydrolase family protein [Gammaproteobacteria bacterium]